MSIRLRTIIMTSISASCLSGCAVVKTTGQVAALPFKATYETTKFVGKSAYKTTEFVGKGAYKTTEFVGKSVIATGKGIYYVGTVPVKITDKALDTSTQVLTMTTKALDATGKAVSLTRQIKAAQLDAELAAVQGATNILSVIVDAL